MAQDVTGVRAICSSPLLPTQVSTAVGNLTTLPLRIGHFATEADVGGRLLRSNFLAGRAAPAFSRVFSLRGGGPGPLLDAVEVEDVVAALAAPHWRHYSNGVATHHTLVLLLGELLYQTPRLGLLALGRVVPPLLGWLLVSVVWSSPLPSVLLLLFLFLLSSVGPLVAWFF